jgi:hypothetical protein
MGPWRETRTVPPSSPGWTRTSNPSVNSRMLCQLSYRGILQMRLYGSWPAASSSRSEGAQGVFELLDLRLELFLPIVIWGLPLTLFTAQYRQPQPRFADGTF